jgi:molybdate/tungstate transport system permease protein
MTPMRAALVMLLVLFLAPILNLLLAVTPRELASALYAPATLAAIRVSLGASLAAVALATVLGVPAAYAIAHARDAWRAALLFLLALPLALPPVASGILLLGVFGARRPIGAWLSAHGLGIVDTFAGVALSEFFVAGSLVAITATAAFSEIDPTYEETARTLGASPARTLWAVALPLAAPGIAAGVLLAWLRALGEYGATSIVAYHPASLPIELYVALSADGLARAIALAEAFFILTALAVAALWLVRRRLA